MKRWLLFLICALGGSSVYSQVQSDCTPIRALQLLYRNDAADMALQRIFTLRTADTATIEIPQPFQDSAMRELAAVCNLGSQLEADSVFRAYCVHRSDQRRFMPAALALQVDTSQPWAMQWYRGNKTTGNPAVDGFLSRHGVEMTHYQFNPSWSPSLNHIATLTATRPINMIAFADSMMRFSGAVQWYFRPRYGDGNDIRYTKSSAGVLLSFIVGWGDCPAGCTSTRTWTYSLDPAACTVDLDTSYFAGARIPYTLPNCDLTPVSVTELPLADVQLFPNPASSSIEVRGLRLTSTSYAILDLSGRSVQQGLLTTGSIDVRELRDGLYLLSINCENGQRILRKFVKN